MKNISSLFKICNINYIVSVDDCYKDLNSSVSDSELIDDILEDSDKYKEIIEEYKLEIDDVNPIAVNRKIVSDFIVKLDDEKVKEKLIKISDENSVLKSEKKSLLDFFTELKKNSVIKDFCTFTNINDGKEFLERDIQRIWSPDENNRILWLVDRDLGEVGKENEGFKLLEIFCGKANVWSIGILATNKLEKIENEVSFDEYLNKYDLDNKNAIWRIDKALIDKNKIEGFTKEVAHGLKRNFTYKITNHLAKTYGDSIDKASEDIKKLQQSTINNIIVEFSNNEGLSSIETLYRMLLIITKHNLYSEVSKKYTEISKILLEYESLCEQFNEKDFKDLKQVNEIRKKEKYNFLINQNYYPIGFGDIFKINGEEYILISQPCDIAIRSNGDRKNSNSIKNGLLVKISEIEPNYSYYGELKYYCEGKIYYVYFKNSIYIDLDIMDICSMNNDGQAMIKIKQLEDQQLDEYKYFKGHRERLKKVVLKVKDAYDKYNKNHDKLSEVERLINSKEDENKDLIIGLIKEYKLESNNCREEVININSFHINDDSINYGIERICRLDELYTINLATEFYNVSSRLGLPGDFASEYKYKLYNIKMENPEKVIDTSSEEFINLNSDILEVRDSDNIIECVYEKIIKIIIGSEETIKIEQEISEKSKDTNKANVLNEIVERYVKIDEKARDIIIKLELLKIVNKQTGNLMVLKKNAFKIPIDVIKNNTDVFYKEVEKYVSENECPYNNLKRFFTLNELNQKVLNSEVTFKSVEIKNRVIEIKVSNLLILRLNLALNRTDKYAFELDVECDEQVAI